MTAPSESKVHLIGVDGVARIEARVESYLHLARRMIIDQFGPEAGGDDHVLSTVTLAAAMANLETAEIVASSEDKVADSIEKKEV
ncbi:hypothetical protein [Aliiroseovarius subalbicans]|uniref:hypothetical protein n=1 Tax=Aliiroseovarius subalbicans TaxID=2925840 RepID=UPI001F57BAB3|nr:hypothetical protein [Aliiroseovarius subalbicans]MCI2397976.1 hypothetical protein [Aliiroseovarius subalbicans]